MENRSTDTALQIVTTVLVTYCVDCHVEHSASIGVFVNVVRSTWAFIGPFWFPDMLTTLGGSGSGGLMAGLIFIVSWVPVVVVQWQGERWRGSFLTDSPASPPVIKKVVTTAEGEDGM